MTTTKERPILFSGPMVQAILAGRKTQTRRLVKPQLISPGKDAYFDAYNGGPEWTWWSPDNRQYLTQILRCPYGRPGDRLWVRETWANGVNQSIYKADFNVDDGFGSHVVELATGKTVPLVWRSSRYMPRWASRITLELTGVRVERLQDISEEDANAEGIRDSANYSARQHFARLWSEINGKRASWSSNPWVWVLEFVRVQDS